MNIRYYKNRFLYGKEWADTVYDSELLIKFAEGTVAYSKYVQRKAARGEPTCN
jgi:hypothetical protein